MEDLAQLAVSQLRRLNATITIANVIYMMSLLDNSECSPAITWGDLIALIDAVQKAIEALNEDE